MELMHTLYKFHFLNGISEINQLFDDILIIWPAPCMYIYIYIYIWTIHICMQFTLYLVCVTWRFTVKYIKWPQKVTINIILMFKYIIIKYLHTCWLSNVSGTRSSLKWWTTPVWNLCGANGLKHASSVWYLLVISHCLKKWHQVWNFVV